MAPTPSDEDVAGTPIESTAAQATSSPEPRRAGATARRASMYALPAGHQLHEFELTEHIGEGGFSIVYRALDRSLERVVALKEYMPGSLATRDEDTTVHVRNESMQATFDAGLRSFVNESKLLASFDHPSLVKVYRFWEANGTAYMVMPFYAGLTLKDTVLGLPGRPSQAWIQDVLAPLTEALTYIHQRQCYHRDIAPDNILMLADSGRPLLLDFGAARRVITDMTQALTVIVKAGYAPIEQYAAMPDMAQGPWTDVHALAAVVYWMITGDKPPAAIARVLKDNYVPLVEQQPPGYSLDVLRAVDRGLAFRPEDRTQTIEAFAEELGLRPASSGFVTSLRIDAAPAQPARAPLDRPDRTATPAVTRVEPRAQDDTIDDSAPDDNATLVQPNASVSIPQPSAHTAPAPPHRPTVFERSAIELQPSPRVEEAAGGDTPATPPRPSGTDAPSPQSIAGSGIARPAHSRAAGRLVLAGGALAAVIVAFGAWLAWRRPAPLAPTTAHVTASPARAPVVIPAGPVTAAQGAASAGAGAANATPAEPTPAALAPAPVRPDAPVATSARERAAPPTARRASMATEANAAECARILQRLSLGDTSQELLERTTTLHCK